MSEATEEVRVLAPARSMTTGLRRIAALLSPAFGCFLTAWRPDAGRDDLGVAAVEGAGAVEEADVVAVRAFVVGTAVPTTLVVGPDVAGPVGATVVRPPFPPPTAGGLDGTLVGSFVCGATGTTGTTGETCETGGLGVGDGPAETGHTRSNGTFVGRSPFPHLQPSMSPSRTWI